MKFLKFLLEFAFKNAIDRDYPSGKESFVVVFDKNEEYKIKGHSHDLISHSIKHLKEFDELFFKAVVKKVKNFIIEETPEIEKWILIGDRKFPLGELVLH